MQQRPLLTKNIDVNHFRNFYWLKSELIAFCRKYHLPANGSKQEIAKRIEGFIMTGVVEKPESNNFVRSRDSDQLITSHTPVVNYKNDTATRKFFVEQIGRHFHFNAYLRQFTDKKNCTGKNLTYGDLAKGWLEQESRKKDPNYLTTIDKQFEYNRFIRDFFIHEKNKSRAEALQAWKIIKAAPGPNTYSHYKHISKNRENVLPKRRNT